MTLDPDALIAAAREQTGLDDFGGDDFREGLELLTKSIAQQSRLSKDGLAAASQQFVHLLATRLQIEHFYREHPQIEEQDVPEPVFMLGLPRTGTTALAALLQCDPERRSLLTWESSSPLPPPETASRDTDPRIAATQAGIDARHAAVPGLRAMYDASATASSECHDLLGMTFRTEHFCGQFWVPDYLAWQRDCDMAPAYRYHRRVLKLLQWRCGPNRWHLHSPVHMLSLPDLLSVYPDALFLMTHRDPVPVLGSVCSLIGTLAALAGPGPDPAELGRVQLETWVLAVQRALRFRQTLGEERFADVYFHELNADPVGSVANAYEKLRLPFSDAARRAMASWAGANPPGRHGAHRYRLEDYGLDAEAVLDAFAFYLDRFDVPVGS
jgi:hypothetical protein